MLSILYLMPLILSFSFIIIFFGHSVFPHLLHIMQSVSCFKIGSNVVPTCNLFHALRLEAME